LTGLDLGHQLDAAALLRAVAKAGTGVVVTLHDLAFAARVADRIIVMAQGRIRADGAPHQALAPDVLADAYGVDARWIDATSGPVLDIIGRHA
jgi:iron complex transport system ATP-binding protein